MALLQSSRDGKAWETLHSDALSVLASQKLALIETEATRLADLTIPALGVEYRIVCEDDRMCITCGIDESGHLKESGAHEFAHICSDLCLSDDVEVRARAVRQRYETLLHEAPTVDAISAVRRHRSEALVYAWGYQDGHGETPDTGESERFADAYGAHAAEWYSALRGSRSNLRSAWQQWRAGKPIC